MRNLLTAGLLAGVALAPHAWAGDAAAPAYDASTVLATVDGTKITLGNVIVMHDQLPQQYQSLPDDVLFKGILDQLVDQTILAEQVSKTPDSDPLKVRLQLENERRGVLAGQVAQEEMAKPVDAAKVKAAYDAQVAAFQPQPEFDASHILVATEDEAKTLLDQIKGGADFAETAKAHSTDSTADKGGELGWFAKGQMVPEFETAVEAMDIGAVAGPVQTQFGWHLIKLNAKRDSTPPPLDQVQADLENQVRQDDLRAHVDQLRAAAKIEMSATDLPPAAIHQSDLVNN